MQELLLSILRARFSASAICRSTRRAMQFAQVIADIRRKSPDWIFCTVIGETVPYLYDAYAHADFDPARMPIGSLSTSETEIRAMDARHRGRATSRPRLIFKASIQKKIIARSRIIRRVMRRGGADRHELEAAYYQMHMFAEAFARAGR